MAYIKCGIDGCYQSHDPKYKPVIEALQAKGVEIDSEACPIHVRGALHLYRSKEEDRKRKEANDAGQQVPFDKPEYPLKGNPPNVEVVPRKLTEESLTKEKTARFLKLSTYNVNVLLEAGLLESAELSQKSRPQAKPITTKSIREFVELVVSDPQMESEELSELPHGLQGTLTYLAVKGYPKYFLGGVLD